VNLRGSPARLASKEGEPVSNLAIRSKTAPAEPNVLPRSSPQRKTRILHKLQKTMLCIAQDVPCCHLFRVGLHSTPMKVISLDMGGAGISRQKKCVGEEERTFRVSSDIHACRAGPAIHDGAMDNAKNPVFDSSVCVDWAACPLGERVAGRVSGVRHSRNSRIPADCIVSNSTPAGVQKRSPICAACRSTWLGEYSTTPPSPERATRVLLDHSLPSLDT
jgi:hypothetical protein